MKKIINLLLLAIIVLAFSCKKQETVAYYTRATAPVLTGTANSGSTVLNLKATDSTLTALSLIWTNPNYTFNTGVNSLTVNYLIEIDTVGSNFTNANKAQISVSDTSAALTEGLINKYLANQMGLLTTITHSLQVRIAAYITTSGNGVATVYSNILSYTAKPYFPDPIVVPPAAGTLWLVGDASAAGWSNPLPSPYDVSQKFTKVADTLYTLTIPLLGTGGYKLIQTQGNWDTQFHALGTTPAALSGTFEQKNSDPQFPSPPAGTYKITINFQRGTYLLVKQ